MVTLNNNWKNDAKARRVLVDSLRDYLAHQISEKKTMRKMFRTLKNYLNTIASM